MCLRLNVIKYVTKYFLNDENPNPNKIKYTAKIFLRNKWESTGLSNSLYYVNLEGTNIQDYASLKNR